MAKRWTEENGNSEVTLTKNYLEHEIGYGIKMMMMMMVYYCCSFNSTNFHSI